MYLSGILILCCFYKNVYGAAPNFVFILTDDQDLLLNGMLPMKNTINLVANQGKTFQNAFVNTPICCPSRSTILTGKYVHNLAIVNNSISGNCSSPTWQQNNEPFSIAALLKKNKNYVTYYSGKYLNEYGSDDAGGIKHVPDGYDWWIGLKGNSRYYNYTLSVNGTKLFHSDRYLTDVLANYSLSFLDNKPSDRPFFMTVAPPAAHAPFTPASRHLNVYEGTKAVRTPSFNQSGINKHWLIRMPPEFLPEDVKILDKVQQHRLESLLSVDELIEKIINKLKSMKVLKDTYIIYTSDNGFHIGQFSQPWDKRQPYETDIRVPFLVSGPNVPKNSSEYFPISAVDIAPTILSLADVPLPQDMDGVSFKSELFATKSKSLDKTIFVEYWGEGNSDKIEQACPWRDDPNLTECTTDEWCKCQDSRNNTYVCVITFEDTETFKLCKFDDKENFVEAYNLTEDPFELNNLANTLPCTTKQRNLYAVKQFQKCSGKSCRIIKMQSRILYPRHKE